MPKGTPNGSPAGAIIAFFSLAFSGFVFWTDLLMVLECVLMFLFTLLGVSEQSMEKRRQKICARGGCILK